METLLRSADALLRRAPATGGGIGIYFMKSGIDRHEVRSESGFVVSLEFGESSG